MNLEAIKASCTAHEGRKNNPYPDTAGWASVGIGHLMIHPITKKPFKFAGASPEELKPLTDEQIDKTFHLDLLQAIGDLDRHVAEWLSYPEAVQNVLVELSFALGWPKLSDFTDMLGAMARADWQRAADELLDSKWHRDVHKRAETLAERIRNA